MCLYPITIRTRPKVGDPRVVTVSCGKCLECVRQKSIEWAFRILDEASQYKDNCFVTLTYNEKHLPVDNSVSRREVQLFVKRLRKALAPVRIRFFACGEYGKKNSRPHYHLIIFNWYPSDSWFFKMDGKTKLYRSPQLERCWGLLDKQTNVFDSFGFSTVAKVTYETALYCAKYMNKYQYDKARYLHRRDPSFVLPSPPFVQMSNRPGIGFNCVYRCDLKYDRIYRNGKSTKIPRYYLKVMERDGVFLDEFKELRQKQGKLVESVTDIEAKRERYKNLFNSKVVKR